MSQRTAADSDGKKHLEEQMERPGTESEPESLVHYFQEENNAVAGIHSGVVVVVVIVVVSLAPLSKKRMNVTFHRVAKV